MEPRLSLSYRTTQEILNWAVPLLGNEPVTGLDGEVDSLLGYRSPMQAGTASRDGANRSEEPRCSPSGSARGSPTASS